MPKILPPAEEKIIRVIRDAIVLDPLISLRSLQDVLEKKGIKVGSLEYLSRLIWKINRGLGVAVDRQKLSERVAQIKEKQRIIIDRLVRIAYYTDDLKKEGLPPPSYRDQIAALNAIMKLELAIINVEMDAGIFERHLGTLEIEKRNRPLQKEVKEKIRQALINWGMFPQELIQKTMETIQELPKKSWFETNHIYDDYETRRMMAKTLKGFCIVYLPHYLTIAPADFHDELLSVLGDHKQKMIEVMGFRGSAKSTFGSLALPLWAALEHPDLYPFIIPIADTGLQSAINIANIKDELENNALIRQDYGEISGKFGEDFTLESEEEWQAKNMLLSNGVRILARSRGQKVRGLRHRQDRPSLVIIDDPEDLEWVRTKENRDKTERWLRGEIIPAIDEAQGRLVVIGNQLHTDALMSRLSKYKGFTHLEYSLIKDGKTRWKAKYPTQQNLDDQRNKVGTTAWQREYLLKVVPEEGADIKEEWIRYYDTEPSEMQTGLSGTGIDLAISKKETADYTSMVSGTSFVTEGIPKIYIKPNPINARLSFHETIETTKAMSIANPFSIFFVESVAYQKAAIEEMERALLPVTAMTAGSDKRARLRAVAVYIQNGTVVFPRHGCEDLIIQLLGFGVEEHDDLVDALVYLILGLVQQGMQNPEVIGLI